MLKRIALAALLSIALSACADRAALPDPASSAPVASGGQPVAPAPAAGSPLDTAGGGGGARGSGVTADTGSAPAAPPAAVSGDVATWTAYDAPQWKIAFRHPAGFAVRTQAPAAGVKDVLQALTVAPAGIPADAPADVGVAQIVVYPSASGSLKDWASQLYPGADQSAATVGGQPALLVKLQTEQFPNEFYLVAGPSFRYTISVLDPAAAPLLTTVVLK